VVVIGPGIGGLLLLTGRPVIGVAINAASFALAAGVITRRPAPASGSAAWPAGSARVTRKRPPSPSRTPCSASPGRSCATTATTSTPAPTTTTGATPLPQRHLQAGKDGLSRARRLAATLRCGAQRDSPSPPSSGPACGMAAIHAASTSNPVPPPHLTFGPSRLMSVPPPVLRPLLTSARSARTSRRGPSARRHDSTTDTQADLPG